MNNFKNTGLLFYKYYFKEIDFSNSESKENENKLKIVNEAIASSSLDPVEINLEQLEIINFTLTTTYPGLLIGSGYSHESSVKGEFKLGFFFDYTTGLPCIPGSSVKGVLRDACEKVEGKYLLSILEELAAGERNSKVKEQVSQFLADEKNKNGLKNFVQYVFIGKRNKDEFLPQKDRDIFFDAFPIASNNENGKFLANDYITPHKHPTNPKLDPFTNPNPIQFLKVLPQVTFQFNFRLTNIGLKKEIKLELFRQILLDLGVGAKTNVGYGHFTE